MSDETPEQWQALWERLSAAVQADLWELIHDPTKRVSEETIAILKAASRQVDPMPLAVSGGHVVGVPFGARIDPGFAKWIEKFGHQDD